MKILLSIYILYFSFNVVRAWDSEQLEVLDVIEEVKENFYNLLNISHDASNQEVKTAFRALSVKLHPDKNLDVDTSVQFRNLVSVYEVLRSSTKRKYYDEVLVKGLPNWRSAVYYYRYVRKMGMAEACIILLVLTTICQYLISWAAYYEKKYTLERVGKSKRKKEVLIKPSMMDTLPVQIPRLIWYIIVVLLPQSLGLIKSACSRQITKEIETEIVEIEMPKEKSVRKRNRGFVLPEGPNFENPLISNLPVDENAVPIRSGGLWTDDDIAELTRLVKKYPSGTLGRWELIGDAMERSVGEVTYMANKIKQSLNKLEAEEQQQPQEIKVKQKTKKNVEITDDNVKKWTQFQQKCLEEALAKFPKGCADRWDRISEHIPDKTKEECILRYRYLAESLKKQKSDDN